LLEDDSSTRLDRGGQPRIGPFCHRVSGCRARASAYYRRPSIQNIFLYRAGTLHLLASETRCSRSGLHSSAVLSGVSYRLLAGSNFPSYSWAWCVRVSGPAAMVLYPFVLYRSDSFIFSASCIRGGITRISALRSKSQQFASSPMVFDTRDSAFVHHHLIALDETFRRGIPLSGSRSRKRCKVEEVSILQPTRTEAGA
jgi:hypothetical protein